MDTKDITVFDGKTLSDIFKEIYLNSVDKKERIDILIEDLRPFIKTVSDAAMLVPIIKEYLDVGVKNDEQLVKIATIMQRLTSATMDAGAGTESSLTEEEKKQLLDQVKSLHTSSQHLSSGVN